MASPRKSVRKRVNISYAKLADDDSDDEFFQDKFGTKPLKKKKTVDSDDEEFTEDSPPFSPPLKQKTKKIVNSSTKSRKTAQEPTQFVRKSAQLTPQPLSKVPLITTTEKSASPIINSVKSTLPEANVKLSSPMVSTNSPVSPPTPLTKNATMFHITPSSGLRIGLSRKNIKKTLHSYIRLSERTPP